MKITEIYLQTSKSNELKDFYQNILGLEIQKTLQNSFVILTEKTKIFFEKADSGNPFYHFAINIPSNKISEAHDWLQERVELLWLHDYENHIADFQNWNAKSVYFKDPAGNIVELISRFDLKEDVGEKFSAKYFRSVSEIGLVFTDELFEKRVSEILSVYHLEYFSKQPPLNQFRAIGDDNGLFICVPENRPWYPTMDANSFAYPMKTFFEEKSITYRLEL